MTPAVAVVFDRLKAFLLPGGDAAARGVRGFRTVQQGRIRSAPGAKWNTLTAEESVDVTTSAFCWEARLGTNVLTSVTVIDAYEQGTGRLVLKKGPIQLKKLEGPEVDTGEIQRYLGYATCFPAMLVNNPSLEFTEIDARTLRLRDRGDSTGAQVDIEVGDDGRPLVTRAMRPMTVGSRIVVTPWTASGADYRERHGMLIPHHVEAAWAPPEGAFTYVELELTAVEILR